MTTPSIYVSLDGGTQGPQGDVGSQGDDGAQGAQGTQGHQGALGVNGPQGFDGAQGPQGGTGTAGNQGSQGSNGPQGNQGFQGSQGHAGSQGAEGAQGPVGVQGPAGFQGAQGASGSQGNQGTQGPVGVQGPQGGGSAGPQGSVGSQGNQGNQGTGGSQGSQGTQGTQGHQGVAGAQGSQGAQGAGDPGGPGENGPQGTQGSQGATGSQGSQGAQGSTGAQGTQGNIGVQGPQGQQGVPGNQGSTGGTGTQGSQGDTGTQGPQGSQGGVGTQGVQGTQGNQGSTGSQGSQGSTGAQGTQGVQGTQGNQGDQGNQGVQGSTGSQGTTGSQGAIGTQGAQGAPANTLTYAGVKTADYSANVNEFIPVDTTSNAVNIALPDHPADKTQVAVGHVIQGATNNVLINASGTDVFKRAAGPTTLNLDFVDQGFWFQYDSASRIWSVFASRLSIGQLDLRYATQQNLTDLNNSLQSFATAAASGAQSNAISASNAGAVTIEQVDSGTYAPVKADVGKRKRFSLGCIITFPVDTGDPTVDIPVGGEITWEQIGTSQMQFVDGGTTSTISFDFFSGHSNATSLDFAVTLPTGVIADHDGICVALHWPTNRSITPPSGWLEIPCDAGPSGDHTRVFKRVDASASEGNTTIHFTSPNTLSVFSYVGVVIHGADRTDWVHQKSAPNSTNTRTAPQITTTINGMVELSFVGDATGVTAGAASTPPGGITFGIFGGTSAASANCSVNVGYGTVAGVTAGTNSMGGRTWTPSKTVSDGITIAVKRQVTTAASVKARPTTALKSAGQWAVGLATKVAANTYSLAGDITT